MRRNSTLFFGVLLTFSVPMLLPCKVNAMDVRTNESFLGDIADTVSSTVLRTSAITNDLRTRSNLQQPDNTDLLSDWYFPENYIVSDTNVVQTGISFEGVNKDEPNKLHFKMAYRTITKPLSLDWIYLRVDPDLAKYIDEINIKNTVNVGAQVSYLRYFERVDENSLSDVNYSGKPTGVADAYAKSDQSKGVIYRVLLDRHFLRAPGSTPKGRGIFTGNWGVFSQMPLEAERNETNIYFNLTKPVNEIQKEIGKDKFGVQLRLQGQASDGKATIAEESVNKNTVADLSSVETSMNNSNWLNAPSVHKITTTYEGKQMGKDGKFSDNLNGTDKTLVRVQNTVLNNLFYGTATDLYRPISFNVEIDPQVWKLISDDDFITVWQVYRENYIAHHDGSASNPPIMLKKNMFVNNRIKLEVNNEKAGTYDSGVYYVKAVESFLNTTSSSPFVGANFIDIPIMPKPLLEDKDKKISAGIRTWFTDVKDNKERVVRNSSASSYITMFPTEINFYDYATKDSDKPLKIKDSTYVVSTFGQVLNGDTIGKSHLIKNFEYVNANPAEYMITRDDGNKVNLFYRRILSDANANVPLIDKETLELGGKVDLTDNVTNMNDLPKGTKVVDITPEGTIDTNKVGIYEGTIEVIYPDGSKDTVKVPVDVVDNRTDADKYTPSVDKETVAQGGKVDLIDNVTNMSDLPKGTKVVDITPEGTIDTNKVGTYEGTVEIIYPDGSKDTVKVPVNVVDKRVDADKYTPSVDKETVELGGKIDLTDNVNNMSDLPKGTKVVDITQEGTIDTNKVGTYEGTVEIIYPDGSKDTIKVPVDVVDNRTDADKYTPSIDKETVEIGGKIDLTDNVNNMSDLPKGTKVVDITPGGTIDTSKVGTYEGTIEVIYPDGSKDTVKVPVDVVDNRTDADKYTPSVDKEAVELGGKVDLTDNVTNMSDLPKGTKVVDITPEGTIDTSKVGTYEGTVEVIYPDGSKDTVKVPVNVVDKRVDADKYTPSVDKEAVELGGKVDLTDNVTNINDLPKGTKVVDITPEGTIDTNKVGTYEGTVEVIYPDGSKDTVKVPVNVVDKRVDADKYTPSVDKETIELGGKVDLTDNVTNMNDLPKGTKVVDKTPEGTIDTNKVGTYEGTIEVIYPDGSKETIKVPVNVVDNRTDADKYTPSTDKETVELGGKVDLTDNVTNMSDLPKGTKVVDITPEGTIDTNKVGTYEGTVEVIYPDGSKDTIKVAVDVIKKDRSGDTGTDSIPTIDDRQIIPEIINKGETSDLTDNISGLPKGTRIEIVKPINSDQIGNQTGIVKVIYPNGFSIIVNIPAIVKDNSNKSNDNYNQRESTIKTNSPQTSDNTNNTAFAIMLVSSLGALAIILKKRSKNKTE